MFLNLQHSAWQNYRLCDTGIATDYARTDSFRTLKREVAHLKNMAELGAELQPHLKSGPPSARDPGSFPGKMTLSFVFRFSPFSFSAAVLSCWRCSVDAGCATSCVLGMDAKARAIWYFCRSFSHLMKQDNTKNNITPSMTAIFDLLTQCYFSGLKCLWKDKIVTVSHSMPCCLGCAYREVLFLRQGADLLFR